MSHKKDIDQFEEEIFVNLSGSQIQQRRAQLKLFARYSYIIKLGQTRFMLPRTDSVDAYSDTMLAVILAISTGKFKKFCSLKTYVYEIFHNKCVDLTRQKMARKNLMYNGHYMIDALINLPDRSCSSLEHVIIRSELNTIAEKLTQLCQSHRRILLLAAEGYSDREIAKLSNYNSADVVKTSRLRSLRKIRAL